MRGLRAVLLVGGVASVAGVGLMVASLAGGGGDGSANGSVPVQGLGDLAGSWVVVNDASAPAPVVGSVEVEVTPQGQLYAVTGCNPLRGQVSVDDSRLVAGPLLSTRRACEPGLMEQERWVGEMLSARPRLEMSGPYLYVHWGEGEKWWLGLERQVRESQPAS